MKNLRRFIFFAVCILIFLFGGFVKNVSTQGLLSTVYVDINSPSQIEDGSQQNPFKTIAGGLAAAASDADVYVAQGTYAEMIVVNSTVHLHGSGTATVITGDPEQTSIVQFNVSGSMDNFYVTSDPILSNDLITDLPVGISIGSGATNITISSCTVDRTQVGIEASTTTSSVTITNNFISNGYIGIGLVAATGSVSLSSNTLSNNTVGIYSSGSSTTMATNVVTSNDVGVRVATRGETSDNFVAILQGNTIAQNNRGVWFDQGSDSLNTTLDLGGGGYSDGENVIENNGESDVYNEAHGTIHAENNSWDQQLLKEVFNDSDIVTH